MKKQRRLALDAMSKAREKNNGRSATVMQQKNNEEPNEEVNRENNEEVNVEDNAELNEEDSEEFKDLQALTTLTEKNPREVRTVKWK